MSAISQAGKPVKGSSRELAGAEATAPRTPFACFASSFWSSGFVGGVAAGVPPPPDAGGFVVVVPPPLLAGVVLVVEVVVVADVDVVDPVDVVVVVLDVDVVDSVVVVVVVEPASQ
jgi:hypothetical protein